MPEAPVTIDGPGLYSLVGGGALLLAEKKNISFNSDSGDRSRANIPPLLALLDLLQWRFSLR